MKDLNLLEERVVHPLAGAGFTHSFFSVNSETVVYTWVTIGIILFLVFMARLALRKKKSVGYFLVTSLTDLFVSMCNQSLGFFSFNHASFIFTIFIFILFCNIISLVPGLEEPTKDLNTTLALGIAQFLYSQASILRMNGIIGYFKGFFEPFFIMFPLNMMERFAKVVSISFRLFGNIFGGAIINKIYFSSIKGRLILETLGIVTGINLLITIFFILFEGFLQAFVFTMLSLTYLSIALQEGAEQGHEEQKCS